MGEEADGKKHQRLVVSCCSLLRLQYLPLRQHALQQRLHSEFRGDSDGLVAELAVSTTVPFGQLSLGVFQIKRPDQTALRVSY